MADSSNLGVPTPRRLGSLGEVAPLALGCWRFGGRDLTETRRLIETAVDVGINLIDTADVYGVDWGDGGFGASEQLLGRVLAKAPELRRHVVLASKGGILPGIPYDSSPSHLEEACEGSLRRLGVETIDLYQIHRPDLFTHPAGVAEALERLVEAGKVRAVGVSNHTASQVEALVAHLDLPLASHQMEFSIAHLDPLRDGTLDQCMRLGIVPLAWSPLAGGNLLTGRHVRTDLIVALDRIAAARGVDRASAALAFVLAHPAAPVAILGTQTPDRIRGAWTAGSIALDRREVYDLIQAAEGAPLP